MKCPECGSKNYRNENTERDVGFRQRGGVFHNTCECGCEFTSEAGGYHVTKHGKYGKGPLRSGSIRDIS
ncbi:hypothetical protein AMJ47_02825 [Parcubacteria bacterium DG_72]|nr:MAG: hypothetical protein AMJ47_02825 [Parcubacteria bacterium DG_72]